MIILVKHKHLCLLFTTLLFGCTFAAPVAGSPGPMKYELLPYDPVADPAAVVMSNDGQARFTVLTPAMIRMEYSPSKEFEDRPSLAFVNRKLEVPKFQKSVGDSVTIVTSELKLVYTGGDFSADSISIVSVNDSSAFKSWNGGMTSAMDPGNLLGTFRTLDRAWNVTLNCSETLVPHCEWGLVSKSGWALVNDSATPVLDGDDWWTDSTGTEYTRKSVSDWYFLGHGHDYRKALMDYTSVGGRIPVFPRYASGVWWTRWYDLNNVDTQKVVSDYRSRGLPMDVFVLDMDWHLKYDWTGYTFDSNLFPHPEDAMGMLKRQGLRMAANLHDATGVGTWEERYEAMCAATNCNRSLRAIPMDWGDKNYVWSLEDIVLKPLEEQGMDFWWIDWQQGESGFGTKGGKMNPTIWSDKTRCTDAKRRGDDTRGMVLARFGGLGNHRYQVGFSGDVAFLDWADLAYQPYFSLTASNVGYGFWSHDIEGPGTDHEMYTRWLQWGSFSAIMRAHDRGMSAGGCKNPFPTRDEDSSRCSTVQAWDVPKAYFEANRDALRARAILIPYIYTQTRIAFDTGVSIIRPLYYDFPEEGMAYAADSQGNFAEYMFGEDMLVSPVVKPSDATTMAQMSTWVPPGTWINVLTGAVEKVPAGGKVVTKYYDLNEIPAWVRGGAVIPTIPMRDGDTIGTAARQYEALELYIAPGADTGSTRVYEDDGTTTAYVDGAFAWTEVTYNRTVNSVTVTIRTTGNHAVVPAQRSYGLELDLTLPVQKAVVNGKTLPITRFPASGAASFVVDKIVGNYVNTGLVSTSADVVITVSFVPGGETVLNGIKGQILHAIAAKRNFDETRVTPGAHKPADAYLAQTASSGPRLEYLAANNFTGFMTQVHNFSTLWKAAMAEVKGMQPPPPPPPGALLQLYNTGRRDHVLCGTEGCELSNADYDRVRIEGYQPKAGATGTTPLNDYWNDEKNDNYATTLSKAPAGYSDATFADGTVMQEPAEGTTPLYCYFSSKAYDHMAVATQEGIAYAKDNGYELCDGYTGGVMGHVYTKPQEGYGSMLYMNVGAVDPNRWAYGMALMEAAQV